ncbi:MAG: AMP-binding protein [Burkholderiaceae bacterium]|nr:AMP-binding protein [Burkholderiaceae bacterium]
MKTTSEKPRMDNYGYDVRDMTIGRLVADKAHRNGERTFLHFMQDGRRLSYREVDELSARIANGLLEQGLGQGSHIAVIMENCPEQMLLYFAIGRIGAVAVPVNTSARGKLLAYFLTQSDSIAVVVEEEFAQRTCEALDEAPAIGRLIVLRAPGQSPPMSPLPRREGLPVTDFALLLQAPSQPPAVEVRFSDLAMLCYTSGTTGPSKANMMTQATVVQYGMTTAEAQGYRFSDIVYIALPINHVNGFLCNLWGAFIADAAVAMSRRFSVSGYWTEVRESGATLTNLVGSMSNMLWAQAPSPTDRDNRLRLCVCTPVPPFALEWETRFDTRVCSSYGQSDFISAAHYTLLDPPSKLGSAGRARAGIEMRIVDDDGLDVAPDEVGELLLRSNNPWSTSLGYYKMPEATVAATRGLWWHTGDRARIDADGYLFFADRKKDALRRRGENISAQEVEAVIMEHPAVAEAAVYAVRSEMSEDEVGVSIVLVHGHQLTPVDLIHFCSRNMAHYMVPRFVHLATALPRTETHKVQKAQLREFAQNHRDQLWDREAAGIVVKR